MFYDISQFPFLENILKNVDKIAAEFDSQRTHPLIQNLLHDEVPTHYHHVEYWTKDSGVHVDQLGYQVGYGKAMPFVIFKKGFPIKQYDVHELLPFTMNQIETVPEMNFSAIFHLPPGGGTHDHAHLLKNMIFHLCLFDMEGESVMRCAGDERILKSRGDYCIFDYSKNHSSYNSGKSSRINLAIDFKPEASVFRS